MKRTLPGTGTELTPEEQPEKLLSAIMRRTATYFTVKERMAGNQRADAQCNPDRDRRSDACCSAEEPWRRCRG